MNHRQGAMGTSLNRLSRRQLVQAAGAGVLLQGGFRAGAAQEASPEPLGSPVPEGRRLRTYPSHGTVTASPGTEISFRGVTAAILGNVRVSASESGGHSGVIMPHGDGRGASYVPDRPFAPGEEVTVTADIPLTDDGDGALVFTVSVPLLPATPPAEREENAPLVDPHIFRSRPDIRPPVINIVTDTGGTAPGYVFLSPRMENGHSGSLIIDNTGEPVWFHKPEPDLSESMDFRVSEYRGQPVLTWWEGAKPTGYGVGHYLIANAAYEVIHTIQVPNGFQGGDHHEFRITSRDTALFGIYAPVEWDLTAQGGAANDGVLDQVVLEVEIETGRVLFEWHALDHIDIDESYQAIPEDPARLYDYVHMNSISEDPDGNYLLSLRHAHSLVLVDRETSEVIWRLNGKRSDFEMGEGAEFAKQHDAQSHGDGLVTLFDNGTANAESGIVSRGLGLQLDYDAMTATVAMEYPHPTGGTSHNQANMQLLPNGNVFLGWGPLVDMSEATADGEVIWHAQLPEGGQSYRAYRHEWTGIPASLPDVVVETDDTVAPTVCVSWNGATGVAEWRVLTGSGENDLEPVTTAEKTGFETAIEVEGVQAWVAVEALDAEGNILAVSRPVQVT